MVVELRAFLPTLAACAAAGHGAHPRAIAARFVELLGALDADLRKSQNKIKELKEKEKALEAMERV